MRLTSGWTRIGSAGRRIFGDLTMALLTVRERGQKKRGEERKALVCSSLLRVSQRGLEALLGDSEARDGARESPVSGMSGESLQALRQILAQEIALGALEGQLAQRHTAKPHRALRMVRQLWRGKERDDLNLDEADSVAGCCARDRLWSMFGNKEQRLPRRLGIGRWSSADRGQDKIEDVVSEVMVPT
jgi:hypothetical protein